MVVLGRSTQKASARAAPAFERSAHGKSADQGGRTAALALTPVGATDTSQDDQPLLAFLADGSDCQIDMLSLILPRPGHEWPPDAVKQRRQRLLSSSRRLRMDCCARRSAGW